MRFRSVVSSPAQPLRVVVAGAGNMGRAWLAAVTAAPGVELTGVADLDLTAAKAAVAAVGRPGLAIGSDAVELAGQTDAQALINVTVPEAHHSVTTAALFAGLPVLGEKPVAESVSRALSLVAATEVTGELFMVSQSRRWNPQLSRLRAMTRQLGPIGTVTTDFFRAPHFGGFREQMAQPLLVDMAIHAFDSVRFLLDCEPVSAYCQSYNPQWSWYAGHASATAVFEMESGTRYVYNGSWCSPGAETSWNGSWRISGQNGTALWNGDDDPILHMEAAPTIADTSPYSGIEGALQMFVQALRTGQRPSGEVHENVMSLAMVEAAVQSARTGRPARLDDVLTRAYVQAIRTEDRPDVCRVLQNWPSVRAALATSSRHVKIR
ncbi:Gfo/Idh/MocA family protein [Actinoplanes sp. NPDC051513]|uniref:Gfo/Idh/MocA family protein n=1 Tax=Actinoplanes sp. NPDC051513 TaxID=3363908 RepID=UPI00379BA858